jgi:hypothetical protein
MPNKDRACGAEIPRPVPRKYDTKSSVCVLLEFTNAILNTSSNNDKKITKNYFLASGLASALLASAFLASALSAFSFGVITLGCGFSLESALGAGADAVVAGAGFVSAGLSAATATRERVVNATAVNTFMDFIESPNLF